MTYQYDFETEVIFSALLINLFSNEKVYMVGGMVRDILMNRPVHDIDLSFCGNVRDYAKRVADYLNASFFMLNMKFQTARIIYKSQTGKRRWIDIVATRENNILEDLEFRDFTVNAIAIDLQDRTKIIDPLQGAMDLKKKILKICRPDSLENDPVRILRAIRLAVQFDWKISSATINAIKSSASKLDDVSAERKRDELFRIFDLPLSNIAIRILDHLNLLEYCFPGFTKATKRDSTFLLDHAIGSIQKLSQFDQLIIGSYSPEGAMDFRQGELVMSLGRFRDPLAAHFQTNIHQDRSLKSLINSCILYYVIIQNTTTQNEPNITDQKPEKLERLVEKVAKELVLSSAEKKWIYDFYAGIGMFKSIIQQDAKLTPELCFLFFNRCTFSGVAACLISLTNALARDEFTLNETDWHKSLELSRYFLDAYFYHYDEWINPPTFINGHDVMKILKIHDGKKIGWWLNQLKIETINGNIKNHKDATKFLVTHKESLN
jgi:tRNA nucleotidyltransferase/poly(A) polymerase